MIADRLPSIQKSCAVKPVFLMMNVTVPSGAAFADSVKPNSKALTRIARVLVEEARARCGNAGEASVKFATSAAASEAIQQADARLHVETRLGLSSSPISAIVRAPLKAPPTGASDWIETGGQTGRKRSSRLSRCSSGTAR